MAMDPAFLMSLFDPVNFEEEVELEQNLKSFLSVLDSVNDEEDIKPNLEGQERQPQPSPKVPSSPPKRGILTRRIHKSRKAFSSTGSCSSIPAKTTEGIDLSAKREKTSLESSQTKKQKSVDPSTTTPVSPTTWELPPVWTHNGALEYSELLKYISDGDLNYLKGLTPSEMEKISLECATWIFRNFSFFMVTIERNRSLSDEVNKLKKDLEEISLEKKYLMAELETKEDAHKVAIDKIKAEVELQHKAGYDKAVKDVLSSISGLKQ